MSMDQDVLLGIVLEGPTDQRTVCGLIDRLIADRIPWIGDLGQWLNSCRTWINVVGSSNLVPWKRIPEIADRKVPKRHGHFKDGPGLEDAVTAVRALRLFQTLSPPPMRWYSFATATAGRSTACMGSSKRVTTALGRSRS